MTRSYSTYDAASLPGLQRLSGILASQGTESHQELLSSTLGMDYVQHVKRRLGRLKPFNLNSVIARTHGHRI